MLLGSLTIPGQPVHLHAAREFIARTLGDAHACTDTAILLTSELVTNSVRHSHSRCPGGTVTIVMINLLSGVRVEVIDDGAISGPAVTPDQADFAEDGRGLRLVETLSARWNYYSDAAGTVTWFELTDPPGE